MILTIACALVHMLAVSASSAGGPPGPQKPQRPESPPSTSPPAAPNRDAPTSPTPPTEPLDLPPTDPKWLERLPKEDREAIDALRGYGPPPLADDLKWLNTDKLDWSRLRGKVVVVQSWTTASTAGRGWPARVANALKDVESNHLQMIALHTPDNAQAAEEFMKRQQPPEGVLVAIDPSGHTCDALGIYKQPVNFVVDKNGVVRYTGLNVNGLKSAAGELVKEPFDRKVIPPRPAPDKPAEDSTSASQYPAIKGAVQGADDFRGKRGPDFAVESWYTRETSVAGRVAVITFWKVEDGRSLGTHGPLNELAQRLEPRAAVVVISSDSRSDFERELVEERLSKSDFQYAVALDRAAKMAGDMKIVSFPYTIVLSRDWIVRWQGPTGALSPNLVQQIIDADNASPPSDARAAAAKKRRWVQ